MKTLMSAFLGAAVPLIGLLVPQGFIGIYGMVVWFGGLLYGAYLAGAFE